MVQAEETEDDKKIKYAMKLLFINLLRVIWMRVDLQTGSRKCTVEDILFTELTHPCAEEKIIGTNLTHTGLISSYLYIHTERSALRCPSAWSSPHLSADAGLWISLFSFSQHAQRHQRQQFLILYRHTDALWQKPLSALNIG